MGVRSNYYTYEDEVDNYGQDHQQLHLEQQWAIGASRRRATFTHGEGYFEQFKAGDDLADYNLPDVVLGGRYRLLYRLGAPPLARQRFCRSRHRGRAALGPRGPDLGRGLAIAMRALHFGQLTWARYASTAAHGSQLLVLRQFEGSRLDRNAFARFVQRSKDGRLAGPRRASVPGGALRDHGHRQRPGAIDVPRDSATFDFLNPKVGLDYRLNDEERVFASVAVAHKEPGRNDFVDAPAGFAATAQSA